MRRKRHDGDGAELRSDIAAPCLHGLVRDQANQDPEAPAVVAHGRSDLTYRLLNLQIQSVVEALVAFGVARNGRIAIVLPDGPELAVTLLAVSALATSAPLNPAYRTPEFEFYLSDLDAQALILGSGVDSPARAVAHARGIPVIELAVQAGAAAGAIQLVKNETRPSASPEFARPGDVALVLHTSGTTSKPKLVPLTHSNLCASARNVQRHFSLTPQDRYLNVMPLFHMQGIMCTISTLLSGGTVVCSPGFDAERFFAWWGEFRPTWYTAAPTIHQAILTQAPRHRDVIERHPLRFLRSSAAPLPRRVQAEMERELKAPAIEGYGLTETCMQSTTNPLPPGRRKPGSVGVPAGPEVAVTDESGRLLPPGETGEVVIRGGNVTLGYAGDGAINLKTFRDGWFRSGDLGRFDRDGYLFVLGRLKDIINRGGEKISPSEVDEVLMSHPAVAHVVTFGMPHPTLGEDIAAAVVLQHDRSATEAEIRQFAAARLAEFRVPRRVLIVDEIPKGPSGKLQRAGLAEVLGLAPARDAPRAPEAPRSAPRTSLERYLTRIWNEVLGLEKTGVDDDFFDLGGHSVLAAQVVTRIKATLGLDLPPHILFEKPTVSELAVLVTKMLGTIDASKADRLLDELERIPDHPEALPKLEKPAY